MLFFLGRKRFPMLGCPNPDCRTSLTGALITKCLVADPGHRVPVGAKRERRRSPRRRFPPPANGCRLCAACRALAAALLEEVVEIFASVIVGYFLSRGDGTQRYEHE